MHGERDSEREELRTTARRFLDAASPLVHVRALCDARSHDAALWKQMAEMGWLGLDLPVERGGSGASFAEVVVVLEELGRAIVPGPFLSTVLVGGLLARWGDPGLAERYLPAVIAGDRIGALALCDSEGGFEVSRLAVTLDHGRLTGQARYVLDGDVADFFVVAARDGDGVTLCVVGADARRVAVAASTTFDRTRRLATVELDGAEIADAHVLGQRGHGMHAYDWVVRRGATAVAVDSLGGARRAMEMSVEYAKLRHQFDRPIGSFQAVKHQCANMLVAVETTRAGVIAATEVLVADDPGSLWPSIAKAHAADSYAEVAGLAIMVHGGIGYTWEHDLHLYLKRAKLNQALFGSSRWHRARIAAAAVGSSRSSTEPVQEKR